MRQVRILAIVPYHGLREIITQVAEKRPDVTVTTHVGDLGAGLALARQAVAQDEYDVILSRGGTADLLSRKMDIPTLAISISPGDILQSIKLAENYQAKFAIVGFPGITERAEMLCRLLNYDISVRTVRDERSVPALMAQLKQENVKMCIGDVVTTNAARAGGLNAILITSNAESIETAIDQAVQLSGSYVRLRQRQRLLERVINQAPLETVAYNADGLPLLDTLAERDDSDLIREYIQSALPALREHRACRLERVIGKSYVTIDARAAAPEAPLTLYVKRKPVPPAFGEGGVMTLNASDTMHESYNRYYGFSGVMEDTNQAIERLGRQHTPIVLAGEEGTGKDSVAAYLYSIGPYAQNPLYVVDCCLLSDKQFTALMKNPDSPLNGVHVTLYFKNIMRLSELRREQLLQFLEQSGARRRCRVICAHLIGEGAVTSAEAEAVHAAVTTRLDAVSLRLPPLRERRGDIPSIAALYLSQLNMTLGKQLTGFDPAALEMLTAFEWPYNLDQFHRVLRELASVTASFYISAEDTAAILRGERARRTPGGAINMNLDQSLEDITYDIVRLILKQENNNQKKTAERLGIGRSTVWRILKSKENGQAPRGG